MPIYAYKCEACGHAKDVLQRMSDPLLTDCPACGAPAFKKQLTAAGFQLKGSGWYVTDFKGGAAPSSAVAGDKSESGDTPKVDAKVDAKADSSSTDSKTAAKSDAKSVAKSETKSTPAPETKAASKPETKTGSGSGSTPASTS